MQKFHTYLALILLVFLACIPPVDFFITIPPHDIWFVMVLIAGFFSLFTLFILTSFFVRTIAIGSFVLCFFSSSPPISFTSYVSIILCVYFFINCMLIEDWRLIFKVLQTLLFLNILLTVMQFFGKDSLLNFGLEKNFTCFGVIGQHMQMGSFAVILSAVLLSFSLGNLLFPIAVAVFCTSTWTFFSACVGGFCLLCSRSKRYTSIFTLTALFIFSIWSIHTDKFTQLTANSGRLPVWENSVRFALQKPWTGWGPGTYKLLYHGLTLSKTYDYRYEAGHNWLVELLFETGIPFTLFVIWWLYDLWWRLWRAKETTLVAGLSMMLCDGMVHFPDRMAQCVPIIICFLAYCEVRLRIVKEP